MRIKPKDGRLVRMPVPPYNIIPEKGIEVKENSYWLRRIKDGDIEKVKAVIVSKAKKAPKIKKSEEKIEPKKSTFNKEVKNDNTN